MYAERAMTPAQTQPAQGTSRFVRACLRHPVDRTPVWFLRQAGRYMPEYMAVRRHHSLLEICRTPDIAAEVTITAAERLGVDAAIIFADLLLPFTPMGLDFEFVNGEGPVVHQPVRSLDAVRALRTDRTDELRYVAEAISRVSTHFRAPRADGDQLGIIGFCGAPFTLASYMIEGGSSRNYVETKRMMYASEARLPEEASFRPEAEGRGGETPVFRPGATAAHPDSAAWHLLMDKLIDVLAAYAKQQVEAGADVIQIFDSWVGSLSVTDYRQYVLGPTTELVRRIQGFGVPVIYFGVDTATLLPAMRETGADVIGLDWRIPLDQGWRAVGTGCAVQGNLDPITLVRSSRGARSPRPRDSHLGRRPPRPHLQPRPWHRPRNASRKRPRGRRSGQTLRPARPHTPRPRRSRERLGRPSLKSRPPAYCWCLLSLVPQ